MTTGHPFDSDLGAKVESLCLEFMDLFAEHRDAVEPILDRYRGPLRVAIAGRVNAGKSTLLNALVGERLAPTDATESTKVITWYEHGPSRSVTAETISGARRPLPFDYSDGRLDIDLDGHRPEELARIVVTWPSGRLANLTLIDTPGLRALDQDAEARTRSLFDPTDGDGEIDAVIYLMRHVHAADTRFLETFRGRAANSGPTNAVAVLSRADQIGAGRPESMRVADEIAARYFADTRIASLVGAVVAVAGLLAEASTTFREEDAATVRSLAGVPDRDRALLSAERVHRAVDVDAADRLLMTVGVFGLRDLVERAASGDASTADEMAKRLLEVSGLEKLRNLLQGRFGARASVLKARSALDRLIGAAATLPNGDAARSWLHGEVERIVASSIELELLRCLDLVTSGGAQTTRQERRELESLLAGSPGPDQTDHGGALDRIGVWRSVAFDPLAEPGRRQLAAAVARAYEALAAESGDAQAADDVPFAPKERHEPTD